MRVSIVQGGGLVPVVTTTVADAATLSADAAAALHARVEEAGLLRMASAAGAAQPERPTWQVVVEDGGHRHELVFDDASLPDAVRSLASWVSSVPGHEERIEPLG